MNKMYDESEEAKINEEDQYSFLEKRYSFVGLMFAAIMVAVGYQNLPMEYSNGEDMPELSEEQKRL